MLIRHWTHPTFGAVALGPAVSFRLPNFALGLAFEQISLKAKPSYASGYSKPVESRSPVEEPGASP